MLQQNTFAYICIYVLESGNTKEKRNNVDDNSTNGVYNYQTA